MIPNHASLLFLLLLVVNQGCGKTSDFQYADLCTASGSLMINGQPAEGAMLIFAPTDGTHGIDERGTRPFAMVNADGSFQVTSYNEGDGLPIGDYRLAIIWEDCPNTSSSWDKLDGQYVNAAKSQITVSVKEGENQFEPIVLEQVRIVDTPKKRKSNSPDGID